MVGLGQRQIAADLLEDALRACKDAPKARMESEILFHLAQLALHNDELEAAEAHLQSAVQTSASTYGEDHIFTVRASFRLAEHFALVGNTDESQSMFAEMTPRLEEFVAQAGEDGTSIGSLSLAMMSSAGISSADIERVIEMSRLGITRTPVYERNLPYLALAMALTETQRIPDAIATLRAGLEGGRIKRSYELIAMERLLLRLLKQRPGEGTVEQALRSFADYRERHLHSSHPATLEAKVRLADWLVDQGRFADAEMMLDSCKALAEHDEASTRRRQFAVETAGRITASLGKR